MQDGTRDGEHIRPWMHGRFVEWLTVHNHPFTILSGPHEDRLRTAVGLVDGLLV